MKKSCYVALLVCLFAACKKDDSTYKPKAGDSLETLLNNWGKPDEKVDPTPAFGGNGLDYYYKSNHQKIVNVKDDRVTNVRNWKYNPETGH